MWRRSVYRSTPPGKFWCSHCSDLTDVADKYVCDVCELPLCELCISLHTLIAMGIPTEGVTCVAPPPEVSNAQDPEAWEQEQQELEVRNDDPSPTSSCRNSRCPNGADAQPSPGGRALKTCQECIDNERDRSPERSPILSRQRTERF